MKIIIFYSSIGQGHISAARSIAEEILKKDPSVIILQKDPSVIILQKDIRDFMDPVIRMLDKNLYWFVAKNLPILYDSLFRSMQEERKRVSSLNYLPSEYSEQQVLEYILKEAPDAVFATHYGAAQVLGNLREKALMPNIKIGWLHTDYFVGYFPRISKRIDRTFLAHPALKKSWLEAGVFSDQAETSGMPVNVCSINAHAPKECLNKIGFQPSIKTIMLASGKEGVGDFPGIVTSIAGASDQPLQIITVCGCNKKQLEGLRRLQHQLPKHIKLEIMGFIPQADLFSFVNASDLFITKAGGLTPSEAFVLGKPTILLSVISGHEKENAEFFAKLGLAEINFTVGEIGRQVISLLGDPERQASMLKAQQVFRENMNIGKIADFLLDPKIKPRSFSPEFGLENGYSAHNVQGALAQMEDNLPADIEILLSYSASKEDEYIVTENPFGHIAIRVGDTVYSSNHRATSAQKSLLLQHMSMTDYLFGVDPISDNQEHTSTYGVAYGRDTLGLRVKGVPMESIQRMHTEAARIEEEFSSGECGYDVKKSNCADYAQRILVASGYYKRQSNPLSAIYTMPLDVFERAHKSFQDSAGFRTELVAYRRLTSSQSPYRFSRFPLSLGQPVRSFAHIINNTAVDPIETKVDAQLVGHYGDERVFYEELSPNGKGSTPADADGSQIRTLKLESILVLEARRLLRQNKIFYVVNTKMQMKKNVENELSRLFDNVSDEMSVFAKKISEFYQTLGQDIQVQDLRNLILEIKTKSKNLENGVEALFRIVPINSAIKKSKDILERLKR